MPNSQDEYDPKVGFEVPQVPVGRSEPDRDRDPAPDPQDDFVAPLYEPGLERFMLVAMVGPAVAILGGLLSAPTALVVNTLEAFERGWWGLSLGAILVAPWVEELVKPLGVYFLVWRWGRFFNSRLYNSLLAALGGLVFAILENLLYIYVTHRGMDAGMVAFRWRYCTALHVVCSAIFGYGVTPAALREALGGGNVE